MVRKVVRQVRRTYPRKRKKPFESRYTFEQTTWKQQRRDSALQVALASVRHRYRRSAIGEVNAILAKAEVWARQQLPRWPKLTNEQQKQVLDPKSDEALAHEILSELHQFMGLRPNEFALGVARSALRIQALHHQAQQLACEHHQMLGEAQRRELSKSSAKAVRERQERRNKSKRLYQQEAERLLGSGTEPHALVGKLLSSSKIPDAHRRSVDTISRYIGDLIEK